MLKWVKVSHGESARFGNYYYHIDELAYGRYYHNLKVYRYQKRRVTPLQVIEPMHPHIMDGWADKGKFTTVGEAKDFARHEAAQKMCHLLGEKRR